jgi:OOP family OmpA-OmpF porin
MNKQISAVVVAAGFLAGSGAATAQQPSVTGWYIGGGVGQSQTKLDNSDFSTGSPAIAESKDEKGTAWKFFGGYQLTQNWGVEGGYAKFGDAKYKYNGGAAGSAEVTYETNSLFIAGTGRLPLGSNFSLLGRIGGTRNEAKLSLSSASGAVATALNAAGITGSSKKTKNAVYLGIGGQYDINRNWGVRLDYDNFGKFGDDTNTGRAKVDMISISGAFRF